MALSLQTTSNLLDNLQKDQLLISTFSLASAVCMTALGARNDTLDEIQKVFTCDHEEYKTLVNDMTKKNVKIANALFPDKSLQVKQQFVEIAKQYYDAEVLPQKFKDPKTASKNINDFVSKKTEGRIQNLVPPQAINDRTKAIVVNTVHLDFKWVYQFNAHKNVRRVFNMVNGEQKKVEMLNQDRPLRLTVRKYGDDAMGLVLPLREEGFSMEFILPRSSDPKAIYSVEKKTFDTPTSEDSVMVRKILIPKFDLSSTLSLKGALQNMGISKAFDTKADFSGISDKDLYITDILQKTRVTVKESGVTASAATAVMMGTTSISLDNEGLEFIVDQPFIAHIRYKDVLLFSMRIVDPTKDQ